MIYPFRVSIYARNIYLYGTTKLSDVAEGYYIPVQQFAAVAFTRANLDKALASGYISTEQYNETLAYV